MSDPTGWQTALQRLLVDDGAELLVDDPDGATVFDAPLARAWRIDDDDRNCLWLRPLTPAVDGGDGTTVFALNQCRRRALNFTAVHVDPDGELLFDLHDGQRARIRPAHGHVMEHLNAWDTFVGARLSAAEETALDALAEDSWHGRYA